MTYARIRKGDKIIGYLRHDLAHTFFSKDFFWWRGEIPEFQESDRYALRDDAKGRRLFEHDIVMVNFSSRLRRNRAFRISFRNDRFYLLDIKSNKRLTLDNDSIKNLEFLSYTFINTTLIYGGSPQ